MPQTVFDALQEYQTAELNYGGYETANRYAEALDNGYQSAATLLGARKDEIAFIETSTRAWDLCAYSIPFQPGDRILTHAAAYGSNFIAFLKLKKRYGLNIDVMPSDASGQLDVEAAAQMIDERVRLIALTHIPTNGGLINPAEALGQVARPEHSFYLLDACQSAGQLALDVEKIQCDMLSTTSRKFMRGPRGQALLYVRDSRLAEIEPLMLDNHAGSWVARDHYTIREDARRFENWEANFAAKFAFGRAIDYALEWGLDSIEARVLDLAARLQQQLNEIQGLRVYDLGQRRSGIVTFGIDNLEPAVIKSYMDDHQVNITISTERSTRLDMEARQIPVLVRASVHYYNNQAEIDRFCSLLADCAKSLRG